jgi:hypothetical protein
MDARDDPLTDSLALDDEIAANPPLRAGWEHEPADPPYHWPLLALIAVAAFALSHCTSGWSGA